MVKTLHSRHNEILLDKLRKLREARGLRQADLALLIGRSQGAVSYVESGQTRLDIIGFAELPPHATRRLRLDKPFKQAELARIVSMACHSGNGGRLIRLAERPGGH